MAFHVCPDCDGQGTKDNFGAFGRDQLDEWFGGDWEDEERFMQQYKSGAFDKVCPYCEGKRVVDDEQLENWNYELEYRAEIEAERRMGA